MSTLEQLDRYEKPPQAVKTRFKWYRTIHSRDIIDDPAIIDTHKLNPGEHSLVVSRESLATAFKSLHQASCSLDASEDEWPTDRGSLSSYVFEGFSGFHVLPSLLSLAAKKDLLSILLHDSLADEKNKTNVHAHHHLPYSACSGSGATSPSRRSFFNASKTTSAYFAPKDDSLHNEFSIAQFLTSKLRWMTLGGQYDWTTKKYPAEEPPQFPKAIADFISALFPDVKPEAAIMNIYRPGENLSMHRDVSEECNNPLISISLGCDGLFMIALKTEACSEPKVLVLRLRSGDVLYLSGPARFAWHGVPRIIEDTCPIGLQDWPAGHFLNELGDDPYDHWRAFLANKRVNLSVRQIRA